MSKYKNRNIISETHGSKIQDETVREYNDTVTNLAGAGDVKVVDSDYQIANKIINGLKINNYDGGTSGSLRSLTQPPKQNQSNPEFFSKKLKDLYYNAVQDENSLLQKKILQMPDKVVGMLSSFQEANSNLQSAVSQPLGAPGSPNVGLMSRNINFLKYLSEFNFNGDNNIDLDVDDDYNLMIKAPDAEPIYVDSLISQQTNTNINSDQMVPVIGDVKELIIDPMDSAGPMPLIEQITVDLNLDNSSEEPMYSLDENVLIESQLSNYDHSNILNNKNVSQSLWPPAAQTAVSAFNTIDIDNIESATPLQKKLLNIFNEYNLSLQGDVNLVEDYMNNGGEKWGIYVGAEVNYNQDNAPLVRFQRDLMSWYFNNEYHTQNVLPYVKGEELVKQGESMEAAKDQYEESKKDSNNSNNILDTQIDKV